MGRYLKIAHMPNTYEIMADPRSLHTLLVGLRSWRRFRRPLRCGVFIMNLTPTYYRKSTKVS